MKKIGLLISTLNCGGAERVVSRLTKILSDKYEIYLILFEDTYKEYEYFGELININVKSSSNLIKKIILPFIRTKRLKKIKKEYNLDLVISFLDSPNIVNILSSTKKCKTIISIRNYIMKEEKQNLKSKILSLIMSKLYHKADKIIAVSEIIKNSLIDKYKIEKNKIVTIYNPYDEEEIEKLCKQKLEEEYNDFFTKRKVFISVGRIMYQKGFWHLVKAFKLVNDKYKNTGLIIIGKDYQNGKLNKLINELELNDSVLLLGHQKNPFKYIYNSYAYVMTSLFEGFPNSMTEAMVCEKTIISVDCKSGPREILDDKQNLTKVAKKIEYVKYGIIVPEVSDIENWNANQTEEEEKILSNAMIELINKQELNKKYSILAKKRSKEFNYNKCKEAYCKTINEVIEKEN